MIRVGSHSRVDQNINYVPRRIVGVGCRIVILFRHQLPVKARRLSSPPHCRVPQFSPPLYGVVVSDVYCEVKSSERRRNLVQKEEKKEKRKYAYAS